MPADAPPEQRKAEFMEFEATLAAKYTSLRKSNPTTAGNAEIFQAREHSQVTVHGDGRLISETKPGLISSRTRGARTRMSKINSDGIIPEQKQQKFALDGNLLWDVESYRDHREVLEPGTELKTVEIRVWWEKPVSMRVDATSQESWESLEVVVTNTKARQQLGYYFDQWGLWRFFDAAKIFYDAEVVDVADEARSTSKRFRGLQNPHVAGNWVMTKEWCDYNFKHRVEERERYLAEVAELEAKAAAAEEEAKDAKGKGVRGKKATKTTQSTVGQKRKRNA